MFEWMNDKPAPMRGARDAAVAMYKRELEDRAAMLLRLGHSPSFVKSRLAANVAWDFPPSAAVGPAAHAADVNRIVDALAKRAAR